MNFPPSFNASSRAQLHAKVNALSSMTLCSYELSESNTSAMGTKLLANAVQDLSRANRPTNFDCMLLMVSQPSAAKLANVLSANNQHFAHAGFEKAQRIAQSLAKIDKHQFAQPFGSEQSIEWHALETCLAITAQANAFNVASTKLINDEGKALVGSIDSELSNLQTLKSQRDSKLNAVQFEAASLSLTAKYFSASNARKLAAQLERAGDNNQHWAIVLFVGDATALQPIKEMFL